MDIVYKSFLMPFYLIICFMYISLLFNIFLLIASAEASQRSQAWSLKSKYKAMIDKDGVIFTDAMLLQIRKLKRELIDKGINMKTHNWITTEYYYASDLCILATDVEALLTSLESRGSAQMCKKIIKQS